MIITPIILCGGSGSRLWPLSRALAPKQFHNLTCTKTMLVSTLDRVSNRKEMELFAPARVVGASKFAGEISEQCRISKAEVGSIILEPLMRDTSAAIAAAIADLSDSDPNKIILVLPSDHHVSDVDGFANIMRTAAESVEESGGIMTIGIQPTRPETQFGYIERGKGEGPVYEIIAFREKPDEETAKKFLASGSFFWNGGIFMFKVSDMVAEFKRQQAGIWKHTKKAFEMGKTVGNLLYLDGYHFSQCDKVSIDFGIMENANTIRTTVADFDWSDVGSWNQLHEVTDQDANNNVLIGDVITHEVHNSYIRAHDRPVAVAGLDDIVVVSQPDALMIVHREKSYLVKDLHKKIADTNWPPKTMNGSGKQIPYVQELSDWLFGNSLSYWAKHGFDYSLGGAHEALDYDGSVVDQGKKRLRVIPRQIYCYAKALELGWNEAECQKIVNHCAHTLTSTGWHKDGGFIHLYNLDGTVQDDTRDMYDQCFVLLGFATMWKATKSPLAKEWGEKTLLFMDEQMADPVYGGYFETPEKSGRRRANPHMHFFEAMITWYQATEDKTYLDRAAKIVELFKTKFFDYDNWRLHEMFDATWKPLEDGTNKVEPGHQYEWVWLLLNYAKLSDDNSVKEYARKLYATALSFGHHPKTDGVAQFVEADGSDLSPIARTWCQTEALKASIAMEQAGMNHDGNLQIRMLDQLYNRYLTTSCEGGWYDAINSDGQIVSTDMPSSTFYHIFCAIVEYLEHNDALNFTTTG